MFIADLQKGTGKADFDVPEIEKRILVGKNPRGQCNFHWFLACYLDRAGKPEAAIDEWKRCIASPLVDLDVRTLAAAQALVDHGVSDKNYENPLLETKADIPRPE